MSQYLFGPCDCCEGDGAITIGGNDGHHDDWFNQWGPRAGFVRMTWIATEARGGEVLKTNCEIARGGDPAFRIEKYPIVPEEAFLSLVDVPGSQSPAGEVGTYSDYTLQSGVSTGQTFHVAVECITTPSTTQFVALIGLPINLPYVLQRYLHFGRYFFDSHGTILRPEESPYQSPMPPFPPFGKILRLNGWLGGPGDRITVRITAGPNPP